MAAKTKKWGARGRAIVKKVDDSLFESLEPMYPDTAGIDIGSEEHYVSVAEGRDEEPVRHFGCLTPDLQAMAEWLKKCRIRTVVMESTGVYWVPVYRILEDAGFEVLLVDAHHAKSVPGRKTDVWDSRWLRKLHTFGLLRGCFIPPRDIQTIRAYWRHRGSLVEECAKQILLMQKSLEQMNVQLAKVISDISGVTGMAIIRAIVAGERDPVALARLKHPKVHSSEETIAKALTGHYSEEHVFTLGQAVQAYDFYQQQIAACDVKIQEGMAQFEDRKPGCGGGAPPKPGSSHRRKNQPHFDLAGELTRIVGIDLTKIPGIQASVAQTIFSEVGFDLASHFPTEKHFCSWLALCPNNRITGGRVRSSRTRKTRNRVTDALRIAAQALHRSTSALGAYYRRMKAKLGAPAAITATAHKLARLIYRMLVHGEAYVEQGQAEYEAQYQQQALKRLQKQAARMGFALVAQTTGELLPAGVS